MTVGSIAQINVSRGGVPKRAVARADIAVQGLVGDCCDHPNIHGGGKQAVLLITAEGIAELAAQGFPLYPGALGENLTTRGLDRRAVRLGQRYLAGGAVLEITKLRLPCATLNIYGAGIQAAMYDAQTQARDPSSLRWGLSGFYASVIQPGPVCTGDTIALLE